MAVALAQHSTTPSSFGNNRMWGTSNFPFSPMAGVQVITVFNEDNQRSKNEYIPVIDFWPSHVISQDKPIGLEEYRGFSLKEWGEIAVSYNKEGVVFFYNFKFVCLYRQTYNDYYPDPYLTVCFELELEGTGASKEAALDDLYRLLDVYFNRTREAYKKPGGYAKVITDTIARQNPWKQSFACTYRQAQKLEGINIDYQHQVI